MILRVYRLNQPTKLIWVSPVCWGKASQAETTLQKEQADFYSTLTKDYATQFANQSAILSSLQSAFGPILAAGPGQTGFTPTEEASLRTSSSDQIASNFASAQTALNENLASRGGGNVFLPSGATAQLEAGLLSSEATTQANTQNELTQQNYALGRQNFLTAAQVLGGAASQYAPTGYISGANTAGSDAFNSANIIQQQNSAWQGELGGILGGAAASFLGGPAFGAGGLFGGATPAPGH